MVMWKYFILFFFQNKTHNFNMAERPRETELMMKTINFTLVGRYQTTRWVGDRLSCSKIGFASRSIKKMSCPWTQPHSLHCSLSSYCCLSAFFFIYTNCFLCYFLTCIFVFPQAINMVMSSTSTRETAPFSGDTRRWCPLFRLCFHLRFYLRRCFIK